MAEDGELAFGSIPNARKGADLGRDPRFALHSATIDRPGRWLGAGLAISTSADGLLPVQAAADAVR
jgi:hypothetical protein